MVEGWQSFMWTERWQAWGQMEMNIPWTKDRQDMLQPKTLMVRDDSYRVMRLETLSDATDEKGNRMLKATGRSIESILEKRAGIPAYASLTTTPQWDFTAALPQDIITTIFETTCVGGSAVDYRNDIPFRWPGTFLAAGSIPMPTTTESLSITFDSVYNEIQSVATMFDLGFRLVRQNDEGKLYFDVYTGDDRTAQQTANDPVIFDPQLNNLSQVEQISSIVEEMTVAVVIAPNGYQVVYSPNYDTLIDGFDRQELIVVANDITLPAGAALTQALTTRGLQELNKNQRQYAFDGIVPPNNGFVYQTDYNLGDLVEERNSSNYGSVMRVTEVTFTSDDQGNNATVPTLVQTKNITPGTWSAVPGTKHWIDEPSTVHWSDYVSG
jgi:Siphovirus ReqiPepy6 Gp37-like protein